MKFKVTSIYDLVRTSIEGFFVFCDRLFNKIYTSEFNPIYRSGTIAVALLSLATLTGVVLVFFYSLSSPYESVQAMESQVWLGRWMRSVHRYSSDAAVIAVVFHLLRMFAQKKSWGKRTLAWISGVFLLGLLMISAWTGFIMVWDTHGQALAIAGAKIVDTIGILPDPLLRSFTGLQDQPPASFFFMNLFLHIVFPLAMVFGIWIHTIKMARATWFPRKSIFLRLAILFVLIGVILPAPLGPKADLLRQAEDYSLDGFFSFWILWTPWTSFVFFAAFFLGLSLLPFVLKPRKDQIPPTSTLDERKCHACTQCVLDCPYEAISMVPRTEGPMISELVAKVDPLRCVSCGLCAASCGPMTIGPASRKGSDQYQAVKQMISELQAQEEKLSDQSVVIACFNQSSAMARLEKKLSRMRNVKIYPVACMGSLHMATIGYLAHYFKNVILAACPERNCTNKDAYFLLRERLEGLRDPGLPGRVDASRVHLISVGDGEEMKVAHFLQSKKEVSRHFSLLSSLTSVLILLLIVGGAQMPAKESSDAILRLSWRLAGQSIKECQELSPEESSRRPVHMQKLENCVEERLDYQLYLAIDGKVVLNETIKPGGFRRDGPLYVMKDIALPEGSYKVQLSFVPKFKVKTEQSVLRLDYEDRVKLQKAEIKLIYLSADQSNLILKERGL